MSLFLYFRSFLLCRWACASAPPKTKSPRPQGCVHVRSGRERALCMFVPVRTKACAHVRIDVLR